MRQFIHLHWLACLVTLLVALSLSLPAQAAPQTIYADALAAGWDDWSGGWATVDLGPTAPVHGGNNSIAVTYTGGWQGLYLAHAGLSPLGFTRLRFYAHGGPSGGQAFQVYATRASGGDGPAVSVAPLVANTWTEIQIPLVDLGVSTIDITGLIWQDRSGGSQPTFYLDDIALIGDEDPDGPVLSGGVLLAAPRRPTALAGWWRGCKSAIRMD